MLVMGLGVIACTYPNLYSRATKLFSEHVIIIDVNFNLEQSNVVVVLIYNRRISAVMLLIPLIWLGSVSQTLLKSFIE